MKRFSILVVLMGCMLAFTTVAVSAASKTTQCEPLMKSVAPHNTVMASQLVNHYEFDAPVMYYIEQRNTKFPNYYSGQTLETLISMELTVIRGPPES